MGIFGRVDQSSAYTSDERFTPQQLRDRATAERLKADKVMQSAEANVKHLMNQAREHARNLVAGAEDLEARAAALEAGGGA